MNMLESYIVERIVEVVNQALRSGLRPTTTFEGGVGQTLINQKLVGYPNRQSICLRGSLQFTQLDGAGDC